MTKEKIFLCIHGHFYQPPRENPWIEEIESQESAQPYQDWNERIYEECYRSNVFARVLDDKGFVLDIVNNLEKISFNIGPTLFSWLEAKHPAVYQKILEADRISAQNLEGHGNAIAQAYHHMILPLANYRDKVTQVIWGIEDFKARFKRMPEAMWLPETACNEETLEVLVEHGLKFLILEPSQAAQVRNLGEPGPWEEKSSGSIDPKQPYRCFLKKDPSRHIDIFFYDGPISKGMGFGDLLFDAKRFMDHFDMAKFFGSDQPQLLHAATDGETFGHHKPFGDRVLAYLTRIEAPRRQYEVVNYGYYLEKNPPRMEVKLKEGEKGEGTSWSCPHGVKRWKDHCGCRGGGASEWTQHWRKPLRETLDWLRDEMIQIFESSGRDYFKDVWQARNDYIHVLLSKESSARDVFFERNGLRAFSSAEKTYCLKLLEMQRHAMLMYTSCGWFFTEISGIETLQILQYAARAIQLTAEISDRNLEEEFLKRLSLAKSNLPELKDGRQIFKKMITPRMMPLEQAVSLYALGSLIGDVYDHKEFFDLYCFRFNLRYNRKESFGDLTLNFGHVSVMSKITREQKDILFIALHMGLYDFRCSLKPFTHGEEMEALEKVFFEELASLHLIELLRKMDEIFGEKYYDLKDLPLRERMATISALTHEGIEKISEELESLYDANRRMSEIYRALGLPIPEEIRYAAELTLQRRLRTALHDLARHEFNPKKTLVLNRIMENAKAFEVEIGRKNAALFLSRALNKNVEKFAAAPQMGLIAESLNIFKIAAKIGARIFHGRPQEQMMALIQKWNFDNSLMPDLIKESPALFFQLLAELQINDTEFRKKIQGKP